MNTDYLFTAQLSSRLQACSQGQLNKGRLDITHPQGQQWSLYFDLGHLVGEAGGMHPVRRWRRQLFRFCPHIQLEPKSILSGKVERCWDYEFLAKLVRQRQILREQMMAIVEASITEVLFDVLQQEQLLRHNSEAHLTYSYSAKEMLYASPLVFIQIDRAYMQAQQAWEAWRQAGLEECSPNMAPAIWHKEQLQQRTSPKAYRSLTALVDGKQTIRDLALKLQQDPLLLTQSIMPYVSKGLMKLIQVPDIGNPGERSTTFSQQAPINGRSHPTGQQANAPLIAYIDDSPRDSQIMEQIITKVGLRYISLQDSVLALPMLLEQKPSLIFLDLVMPIANGYEICAQIRRTSIFKDTPVIIVTGNDGIVDRVRAKVVRSTDFLAKPIDAKKVLAVLRRYLAISTLMNTDNYHNA